VQVNVAVLQVWLPELMTRAGFSSQGSLSFLIALNGGAVVGALIVSRVADRIGVKPVVAGQLLIGAIALWLVTFDFPIAVLLVLVAFVGLGAGAVVNLPYGFMAHYFRTNIRGAGLAWGTSWGRLGNIVGPVILGVLVGAGLVLNSIFYLLVGVALAAMVLTLLVPIERAIDPVPVEPGPAPAATTERPSRWVD
jgi:AAHS family benzoate transporter-like MFS transporter